MKVFSMLTFGSVLVLEHLSSLGYAADKQPTGTTPGGKKLIVLIGKPKSIAIRGLENNHPLRSPDDKGKYSDAPFGIGKVRGKGDKDQMYFDDWWFGFSASKDDTLDGPTVGTWFAGDHWKTSTIADACQVLGLKTKEWKAKGWVAFSEAEGGGGYYLYVNQLNPKFQIRLSNLGTHNVWLLRVQ